MNDIEELSKFYDEHGPADADSLCASEQWIGSICLTCKRVYRLVPSRRDGGGLSHGWCSDACMPSPEPQPSRPRSIAPESGKLDHAHAK